MRLSARRRVCPFLSKILATAVPVVSACVFATLQADAAARATTAEAARDVALLEKVSLRSEWHCLHVC